jgi:DNA-binding CsgD family transcriptional regulator
MSVQRKRYTSKLYRDKTGAKPAQRLLDLRKTQLDIHSKISSALKAEPKTIPEISKEIGIDEKTVFWYLTTYFKYNQISVAGKTDEGYYRYALKQQQGST